MRLSSLNDLKKKEEEEGKRNELFAGGLDQRGGGSGLAVLGPPSGSGRPNLGANSGGIFNGIVQRAREDTAEAPEASEGGGSGTMITFYRNGFTIGNGPLRDPETPENRRFLMDLMQGKVPSELSAGRNPADDLNLQLSDKRDQDYVPPPYIAFGGAANVLSSSSSASASSAFSAGALASVPPSSSEDNMVNVMVRTHDNKRLKIRISGNATVNQLAAQVLREGGYTDRSLRFTLSAGFPPKELTDGNATVNNAGLAGASVTMKKI